MYSEALRIMDENTVKFMIDELKAAISQKDVEISQKDAEIKSLREQLAKHEKQE